ncbi:MAG: hypothetical protein P1U74_11355 [Legionellaceae bacterium]|nr:hypothetical protein [Legionellaceae bacterium]
MSIFDAIQAFLQKFDEELLKSPSKGSFTNKDIVDIVCFKCKSGGANRLAAALLLYTDLESSYSKDDIRKLFAIINILKLAGK